MTSNRSSLNKKMTYTGTVLKRKNWVTALTVLAMFLFFVIGFGLWINHLADTAEPAYFAEQLEGFAESFLGRESPFLVIITFLAAVHGLQGFSWLHRRTSADFYLSEPYTRGKQMAAEMLCSVIQTAVFLAVFELIGFFIARGFGAGGPELVKAVLQGYAAEMAYFLAIYMLAVFSCFICGTPLMSVLVFIYFMAVETAYRLLVNEYMSTYFATFFDYNQRYSSTGIDCLASPVYNLFVESFTVSVIRNLIFAAVMCIFAYLAFRRRPAEKAGRAFVFAPIYLAVKLSCAFLAALTAGWLLEQSFDSVNKPLGAPVIIIIVVAGAVVCLIFEVIYSARLSALRKRLWHIAAVCGAALVFLYVFKTDTFHYDSYLPKPEEVEDCALFASGDYRSYHLIEDGDTVLVNMRNEPRDKDMHLRDVDAVIELARIGQEKLVESRKGEKEYYYDLRDVDSFGTFVVVYHLKNGKDICRSIEIPLDIDASLMDRVIGKKEYWENYYFIDILTQNNVFTEEMKNLNMYYSTSAGRESKALSGTEDDLRGFLKVYRSDLEKNFRYSVISKSHPIGVVNVGGKLSDTGYAQNYYSFPVFPEYKGTVEYLKANDLYVNELPDVSAVTELRIYPETYLSPDYIYSNNSGDNYPVNIPGGIWYYSLTDKDKIAAFLSASEEYAGDTDLSEYSANSYQFTSLHRYRPMYLEAVTDDTVSYLLVRTGTELPELP